MIGLGGQGSAVCDATLIVVTNLRCSSGGPALLSASPPRKPSKHFAVLCLDTPKVVSSRPPSMRVSFPSPDHVRKWQTVLTFSTGWDFEAWRDWRRVLHRSPSELQEAIALVGRVDPYIDPKFKKKPGGCYDSYVACSCVVWYHSGHPWRPPLEFFVLPKKLGIQMLIFDTRRVNQHFRRPWHCALPTPASWEGLQLSVGFTFHMAQADVNNAFYRILTAPGMSEYFIFAKRAHSTPPAGRCGGSRSFAAFA